MPLLETKATKQEPKKKNRLKIKPLYELDKEISIGGKTRKINYKSDPVVSFLKGEEFFNKEDSIFNKQDQDKEQPNNQFIDRAKLKALNASSGALRIAITGGVHTLETAGGYTDRLLRGGINKATGIELEPIKNTAPLSEAIDRTINRSIGKEVEKLIAGNEDYYQTNSEYYKEMKEELEKDEEEPATIKGVIDFLGDPFNQDILIPSAAGSVLGSFGIGGLSAIGTGVKAVPKILNNIKDPIKRKKYTDRFQDIATAVRAGATQGSFDAGAISFEAREKIMQENPNLTEEEVNVRVLGAFIESMTKAPVQAVQWLYIFKAFKPLAKHADYLGSRARKIAGNTANIAIQGIIEGVEELFDEDVVNRAAADIADQGRIAPFEYPRLRLLSDLDT